MGHVPTKRTQRAALARISARQPAMAQSAEAACLERIPVILNHLSTGQGVNAL
jgi:hypothetical protein